jgi:hypothetical protein
VAHLNINNYLHKRYLNLGTWYMIMSIEAMLFPSIAFENSKWKWSYSMVVVVVVTF